MKDKIRGGSTTQKLPHVPPENLINALGCPIFFQDQEGIYSGCNTAFAELITGLTIDQIAGKAAADLNGDLPADLVTDTPVNKEIETIDRHGNQCCEATISCTDGRTRHFAIHTSIYKDSDGKPAGIMGMMQDITSEYEHKAMLIDHQDKLEDMVSRRSAELMEANKRLSNEIEERRQAQTACKFNEERYHQIFESTGTATILIEPDMTIAMANAQAEKLVGIPRKQFVGKANTLDFVSPTYQEELKLYHELLMKGDPNVPRSYEFQSKDANGYFRDVVASAEFIAETQQVVVSMLDITESNRAQKERQRLAAVIDQSTEAVIITDTHGKVEYVNQAFEVISGFSKEACIGLNMDAPFFSDMDRSIFKKMTFMVSAEDTWSGRMENECRDGRLYIADTRIFPICDTKGKPINLVCVKRDVTHEAQMEKQMQQGQKMEAIGTLAGGIAHDFNNILGGILGYTEICRLKIGKNENVHRYLGNILDGCQRAKELVANILAFSRKKNEEANPIEVRMIIKEAMKLLRASMPSTVEFKQQISSEPGIVVATPTQIHQIIMNLCTNASQAMQEMGGELGVSCERVTLTSDDCTDEPRLSPGPHVRLTISDTGPGMPQTVLNRIFEPYFTTKSVNGGTGLGLSVVHGIVENIGGCISASSQPGKGATFIVHLPCVEEKTSTDMPPEENIPKGDETILVVDDELFILEIMSDMLQTAGYTVETTISSAEALDIFRKDPDHFNLVIADHTMPKIPGKLLAKEIKALRPAMPIVLTTGLTFDSVTIKDTLSDFAAVLKKPILYKDLANTLREVLDSV